MMLEAEAIATAAGVLRADDFYKPAHSHIFDAVMRVRVGSRSIRSRWPTRSVATACSRRSAGHRRSSTHGLTPPPRTRRLRPAHRREHALLRRLIGRRRRDRGDRLRPARRHQQGARPCRVDGLRGHQRRVTDSTSKIEDLLGLNLDRLEQLYGRGDAITGVPTGYVDLDELLSGLQPSNLVIVGARPAMGKCVAWDTPIVDAATGEVRTAAEVHRAGTSGRGEISGLTLTDAGAVARPSQRLRRRRCQGVYRCAPRRTARSARRARTPSSPRRLGAPHRPAPERWRRAASCRFSPASELPGDEVVMLAPPRDGTGCCPTQPKLWTENRESRPTSTTAATLFGVHVADRALPGGGRTWDVTAGDGLVALARHHDISPALEGRRVPRAVFRLPRNLVARFLNRALGASARVWRPLDGEPGRLVVSTRSRGLASDLQHLLLRFGIVSSVEQAVVAVDELTWTAHEVVVDGADHLVALATQIGLLGHEAELGAVVAHARNVATPRGLRAACAAVGRRPPVAMPAGATARRSGPGGGAGAGRPR